jgi:hypothetical protein
MEAVGLNGIPIFVDLLASIELFYSIFILILQSKKMKTLENVLERIREYFNKLKKSSHLKNKPLLENRLVEIEKIINSTDSNGMIVSRMTKDLNLIIENMRQCLGCMRKEINNDTNLAFGDYNKFFIMNQSEKEKGSISDQIVFFVPTKDENGSESMSFILDRVYGSKSSDILISNILSVYKKYQTIKKNFEESNISITVSNEALSSVGISADILEKRLREKISENITTRTSTNFVATIPKSALAKIDSLELWLIATITSASFMPAIC